MTQPPTYTRQFDFAGFSTATPASPHTGSQIDGEFNAIKVTSDAQNVSIARLENDDGTLKNSVIHPDAFNTAALALMAGSWTPQGAWVTSTAYAVSDVVTDDGFTYVCVTAHTSGTFATDLAAGKWIEFASAEARGYAAISVAGAADVTLTGDQYKNRAIEFTGALTGNISVIFPTDEKDWIIRNNTTGAYTLTVKVASQTGVAITQGVTREVYGNGTDLIAVMASPIAVTEGGTGGVTPATARTSLGVAIGTDVLAQSTVLDAVAALSPTAGQTLRFLTATTVEAVDLPGKGPIDGLTLSNAADADHDITVAAGTCWDGTKAQILNLAGALTKQLDAGWSVGDAAGGLDTGAVAANTDYFVFAIYRSDTGVTDALYSLSGASPTMPTNYTHQRLIGMVHTDGSSNIIAFTQSGDYFRYTGDVIADVNDNTITSNTPEVGTISVPPNCLAHVYVDFTNSGQTATRTSFSLRTNGAADLPTAGSREGIYIQNDTSGSAMDQMTMAATVLVDGSSQVQYAAEEVDGATTCRINTFGFTMLTRSQI